MSGMVMTVHRYGKRPAADMTLQHVCCWRSDVKPNIQSEGHEQCVTLSGAGSDTLRQGICRQLRTRSALRRSIRRGSLEDSMEETFVNDSELDKHVFCLVNSKKRHIGAPAESLLELKSGSEAVTVKAEFAGQIFASQGQATNSLNSKSNRQRRPGGVGQNGSPEVMMHRRFWPDQGASWRKGLEGKGLEKRRGWRKEGDGEEYRRDKSSG